MGDYVAGPNHTLPTGGTARFFSPLSVWSFLKTSHVVEFTREGFEALAGPVITIAEAEGLTAHAEAVRRRLPRI
jgi:histidinol dehydrogenase